MMIYAGLENIFLLNLKTNSLDFRISLLVINLDTNSVEFSPVSITSGSTLKLCYEGQSARDANEYVLL